jgi:hypothetical protein
MAGLRPPALRTGIAACGADDAAACGHSIAAPIGRDLAPVEAVEYRGAQDQLIGARHSATWRDRIAGHGEDGEARLRVAHPSYFPTTLTGVSVKPRPRSASAGLSRGLLEAVPIEPHWQDVATENRVRIQNLEKEAERQRTRIHEISQSVAPITYLAQQVGQVSTELHEMSKRLETLARRAVERPTPSGLSAASGLVSSAVAVIALIIALTH